MLKQILALVGLIFSLSVHAADVDGDGLDDSVETNTGIYISVTDTGTDPNNADSDNDTIPDGLDMPPLRTPLIKSWAVEPGGKHSCALVDNNVYCWGSNDVGQSTVPALSNPMMVSAGYQHSCAIDDNGVQCWGRNDAGQGTVPALSNPVAIDLSWLHSCAIDDNGVQCWGSNSNNQITPPPLSNPVSVSLGESHTCALDDTGVQCWGLNNFGQTSPPSLINPVSVASGDYHNCALDDTGVVCWGGNDEGQTLVPILNNPVMVTSGRFHSCALDDYGVVCWGAAVSQNFYFGQTRAPTLSNPVSVTASDYHSCALDDNGFKCWGRNDSGQTAVPTLSFDKDLDGTPDEMDDFPLDPTESIDTDGDGIGNNTDTDDDGDGFSDSLENQYLGAPFYLDPLIPSRYSPGDDPDGNGMTVLEEMQNGMYIDTDDDGLTDYYEINVSGTDPGGVTTLTTGPLPINGDMDNDGDLNISDMLLLQKEILTP